MIAIGSSIVFDASSDGPDALWKNSSIAVRSNRDRGTIEPRSWSVRGGINSTIVRQCFREDLQRDRRPIDARSGHDRGRSRQKSWLGRSGNRGKIEANSWPIPKLRRRPNESLPRPSKTASTTAPMTHGIEPISPL